MDPVQSPAASALARIGWRAEDDALPGAATDGGRRIARVVEQHRSGYRVDDGASVFAVAAPASMVRAGVDPLARPAVGDWVVLAPGQPPLVERLLPRRSALVRGAAGERHVAQVIAANVDVVLVVCGLDDDFNPRRIERYLVLVEGSGAQPVVVLTKADRCDDPAARRREVERLAPGAVVLAVNAKDLATAEQLAPFVRGGSTVVLVGSSGAGKSTLTNTLLGIEKQKTSEVRESDSRGRHTTVHRALIPLPAGGCLIDTPGMRELKLTGAEDLDAGQFGDIAELATGCRFRDCAHGAEPGCAVQAALAEGRLDRGHWDNWLKLQAELGAARDSLAAQQVRKRHEKVMNRALGKRLTDKYGAR
ncbi:MAG: ribosome small subunit-dependent GTPase A [Xanthomonadaceae bacterium]|nr:ribosome small subunit-dependent GTPase A [Xanthomonadaceae bacterium]